LQDRQNKKGNVEHETDEKMVFHEIEFLSARYVWVGEPIRG